MMRSHHGDTEARRKQNTGIATPVGKAMERFLRSLREPFAVGPEEVFLSGSLGIALAEADSDPDALLGDAAHAIADPLRVATSLALEDAATLRALLAPAIPGRTLAAGLDAYASQRRARVLRLARQSRRLSAVLQARGFKKTDFAKHHPSGAIGRALLLRVSDIMRAGARNPVARETLTVQEALLVMSGAKAGSVSVVNSRGKLVGVFTDGDLRRRLSSGDKVLGRSLTQVMTRKPICVRADALGAEALKIFNERNIDDLIVVNAKREPVGLVDSQDLPKLKLM